MKKILAMCFFGFFASGGSVSSAPYIPADYDVVLFEQRTTNDQTPTHWSQLRQALRDDPRDIPAATMLVKAYLQQSSASADARYVSYAQGVLGSWWNDANPTPAIRVARAAVKQALHQFADALDDLTSALDAAPANAQARLMRANIYQVTGEYRKAAKDCSALFRRVSMHIAYACFAGSAFSAKEVKQSLVLLDKIERLDGPTSVDERIWFTQIRADLARRQGDLISALRYVEQLPSSAINYPAIRIMRADLLLDLDRNNEVIKQYSDVKNDFALLLRVAIAQKRTNDAAQAHAREMLSAFFLAAQTRGDRRHLREEGMFALYVERNAKKALTLAVANWSVQREPTDQKLLLDASNAAKQPQAASEVLALLQSGLYDVPIQHAAMQQRGAL